MHKSSFFQTLTWEKLGGKLQMHITRTFFAPEQERYQKQCHCSGVPREVLYLSPELVVTPQTTFIIMQRRYPYSECFLPQCSASHSAENERFEQSIISPGSQCLKISQKVAFNIASEASYVYILSRQKFIENAKKSSILASFLKN